MDELLAMMYACEALAKDLHYNLRGSEFYSFHLISDKVDLSDERDELIETYYLGQMGIDAPLTEALYSRSAAIVSDVRKDAPVIQDALSVALMRLSYTIEDVKQTARPMAGVHAVLDSISQKALVASALLKRMINA